MNRYIALHFTLLLMLVLATPIFSAPPIDADISYSGDWIIARHTLGFHSSPTTVAVQKNRTTGSYELSVMQLSDGIVSIHKSLRLENSSARSDSLPVDWTSTVLNEEYLSPMLSIQTTPDTPPLSIYCRIFVDLAQHIEEVLKQEIVVELPDDHAPRRRRTLCSIM